LYDESNGYGKEFTQLHVMLELLKLKVSHGWSDNSFSDLLSLLAKLLSKPNTLPTSTYRVKKLICPLSLGVEKIHPCLNHCILYRKEHEFKTKCPVCGVSQYKRSYNHVYVDTMKNKNKKTAISPESVDDDTDSDKEDKKKRKIPALVMWYLPVIDRLKRVFSNLGMRNWCAAILRSVGKMMRRFDTLWMELGEKNLIFNIKHLTQRVEI
jgi:hypothetical protein